MNTEPTIPSPAFPIGLRRRIVTEGIPCSVPLALAALLLYLALPAPSRAQEATFTERTEVRVVHLDVLVTARNGSAVLDLEREDFVVTEDGDPVEIDFFERPGTLVVSPPSTEQDTPQPATTTISHGPIEWIVFVDDARLDGAARKRIMRDLVGLVAQWDDGAKLRVMVHRKSEILERGPFTDPVEMIAAIREVPKGIVDGVLSKIARDRALDVLAGVREGCAASGQDLCTDCWGQQLAVATRHAIDETRRVEEVALRLRDLLSRFDPSQGRRSVLYVGDGLPMLAGASVLWSLAEQCPDRRSEIESEVAGYNQERVFEEVGALANAQRVGFFMLDAGGLRHSASAQDMEHNRNIQTGFLTLAKATGGEAILNANRPAEPIRAAVREDSARYELGFTLSRPPTGGVHRIEVMLRPESARGRSLSYRRSFWDRTPDMRFLARMQAAAEGVTAGRPAPSLAVHDVEKLEKRSRKVDLAIAIPTQLATVLPSGPGTTAGVMTLALYHSARGDSGGQPRSQRIRLGSGGLQPEGDAYRLVIGVVVDVGERDFVLGVRDEATGDIAVARLRAKIR